MPVKTLSLEYAVQISFPVGEGLSAGIISSIAVIVAPLLTMLGSYYQDSI